MPHISPIPGGKMKQPVTALENLVSSKLPLAIREATVRYGSATEIAQDPARIFSIPSVAQLAAGLDEYRTRGRELTEEHLTLALINYFAQNNVEITRDYGLQASCETHGSVAKLSIEKNGRPLDQILSGPVSHRDLVYSHHNEPIMLGQLMCPHCQNPTSLSQYANITRVKRKKSARLEEDIVSDIAASLLGTNHPKRKEGLLKTDLEMALGIGSTFLSLTDAADQVRSRLVNVEDRLRIAAPNGKNPYKILNGKMASEPGRAELAAAIGNSIAKYVEPPLLVVISRIKGKSFGDKFLLMKYSDAIQQGIEDGTLAQYFKERNMPLPNRPSTHALDDVIALRAIVHGDAVSYQHARRDDPLPPGEENARTRIYDLFFKIAEVEDEYKAMNGKRPKHKGQNDSNHRTPKYLELEPKTTTKGIYVSFGDVDDYIACPKSTGYQALHFTGTALSPDPQYPIKFELQIKSNYSDTMEEIEGKQSHALWKQKQELMVQYLVDRGAVTRDEVYLTRLLLAPEHQRFNIRP